MRHILVTLLFLAPATSFAADMTVSPGGDIQAAIDQAMPGDTVTIEAGDYQVDELTSARDGEPNAPITVVGEGDVTLLLQAGNSRLFDVQHAHFHLDSVTLDGQFEDARIMRIDDGADGFQMRNVEARNAANHCIDIRNTSDIVIEDSLIHHCLVWDNGRGDAHGLSVGGVQRLTVRNTEIHSFTGDALQVDPGRNEPGWDDVVVDGCTFWLAPIDDGAGGVPNGVVPGENAIDTKTADGAVGTLTIRDTVAYGFRNGEFSNMAAYNLKEDIEVFADSLSVFDSEIAFRIRGRTLHGAQPVLTNIVIYDVDTALRLEGDLQATIPVHHVTFGRDIGQLVEDGGDGADVSVLDPQNVLVLGPVPAELSGTEAVEADFENVASDNYIPVAAASWLDTGDDLGIDHDRRGAMRPQGVGPDPGAYEFGDAPAPDMGFPPIDMGAGNNSPGDMGGSANNANNMSNGANNQSGGMSGDMGSGGLADGGSIDEGEPGGCSCSSTGSTPGSLFLLLALVAMRRGGGAPRTTRARRPAPQ